MKRMISCRACGSLLIVLLMWAVASPVLAAQTTPVPTINNPLAPTTVSPGGPGFNLTVNGTGFVPGSIVNWNGGPRPTTFISRSQLVASVSTLDVAMPGTGSITVQNPNVNIASNVAFVSIAVAVVSTSLQPSSKLSGLATAQIMADFDGDGRLDVAGFDSSIDGGNGLLTVYLGNGDGSFQAATTFSIGIPFSNALVPGDFNGDGKLDVAVASGCDGSQGCTGAITVLLGNGDGSFQAPSDSSATGNFPNSLAVADFNRDGKLDLVISNGFDGTLSLLLGNGDGTFQPQIILPGAGGQIVVGDFNGDGFIDLAAGSSGNGAMTGVVVWLGNGDGTFQPSNLSATAPWGVSGLTAADLNGDGTLDLAVTAACQDTPCGGGVTLTPGTVSILLGNGDGTFQPYFGGYAVGFVAESIAAADVNGDGILDLTVGTRCGADISCQEPGEDFPISVLFGNGDGTFQAQIEPQVSQGGSISAIGDLNGDGRPDLVSSWPNFLLQTTVALSTPSLTFSGQNVSSSSSPLSSTVSNIATKGALTIAGAQVSGTNASDFTATTTCPGKLQPKSACKLNVTFTPTRTGTRSAVVSITDSAVGSPHKVTVVGTGTAPVVKFGRTSVNFNTHVVNTESAIQKVNLANTGTGTLSITGITASGDFSETNNCGKGIQAGTSCLISITFRPTSGGHRVGTLSVAGNAAGSPQTVALNGSGTFFTLSSAAVRFGSQAVGTTSDPMQVTLTNLSPKTSGTVSFTITGASPGDFAQTSTCGTLLKAQATCTISVTFRPTAQGSRTGSLQVLGGGGAPGAVTLGGRGD